eukprot:m.41250 g.41250  ORF g.41250 m.41250 type:complete len:303 (-) comp14207_c0_seq2:1067-1975(-)
MILAVTVVTTLHEVVALLLPAAVGAVELERPQEVAGRLEVGADSEDLVDQILDAHNALVTQRLLHNGVVAQRDALAVHLGVAALVHELLDGLEVGVTVGNVRLGNAQHVDGGLVELDEDTVVDLQQAQQLQHLAHLGRHAVDTADTDDKGELGLRRHVEVSRVAGLAGEADLLTLQAAVLLRVLLGALEDGLAVGLTLLLQGNGVLGLGGSNLLVALAAQQQRLGHAASRGGSSSSSLLGGRLLGVLLALVSHGAQGLRRRWKKGHLCPVSSAQFSVHHVAVELVAFSGGGGGSGIGCQTVR